MKNKDIIVGRRYHVTVVPGQRSEFGRKRGPIVEVLEKDVHFAKTVATSGMSMHFHEVTHERGIRVRIVANERGEDVENGNVIIYEAADFVQPEEARRVELERQGDEVERKRHENVTVERAVNRLRELGIEAGYTPHIEWTNPPTRARVIISPDAAEKLLRRLDG